MTALLETRNVLKRFGGLHAVDDVSFDLDAQQILGLIGPNGSGKTTLLSLISGTQQPTSGHVVLDGNDISGKGPRATTQAGVARTFQTTRLFPSWTLRRVVRLAQRERPVRRRTDVDGLEIVELLGLIDAVDRPCGSLTNADQRLAMIAAALGTGPRVLLLDEPAVGMDASEARVLAHAIVRVRDELGIAVIVVDHNMHFLMPLADDVIVMASGRILARGTPAQVRADEAVIASYLGS